ncbi:hypothetical protein LTS18_015103 [Coniosporium uncinatum]|uniref:Uncharacterized protein n=1 Tax=Coniosporium uncinatum TaxID=93489 RepID=A0ACC3D8Y5_9PEZI|nr:hypothetical protein LTS18_015103 [Coniosporium uncinatum]
MSARAGKRAPAKRTKEVSESDSAPDATAGAEPASQATQMPDASDPDPSSNLPPSDSSDGLFVGSTAAETPQAHDSSQPPEGSRPSSAAGSASARAPVKRLDSIKRPGLSTRGSRGRGAKPVVQAPRGRGRRTQEERERLQREEDDRRKALNADLAEEAARREAALAKERRFNERGRGRGRGGQRGGRGGFMGQGMPVVSGPFSGVVPGGGSKPMGGFRVAGSSFGVGVGSSASSSRVKKEPAIKADPSRSHDPDIKMLFAGGEDIKHEDEDGGYISSDQDEATYGRRVDVDMIDLTISDDEATAAEGEPSTSEAKPRRRHQTPGLFPVRVPRVEHQERTLGINTESSTAATSEKRKEAQEGDAEPTEDGAVSDTRKGKARAREVEMLRSERRWKGVYDEENDIFVKDEPTEGPAMSDVPTSEDQPPDSVKDPPSSPEKRAKARVRNRTRPQDVFTPELTKDEHEEQARHQFELETLQKEIGNLNIPDSTGPQDDSGDTEMKDPTKLDKDDHKQDVVYLFQFPPVLPELIPNTEAVKKEPESPILTARPDPSATDKSANTKEKPVKIEDDNADGPESADGKKRKLKTDLDRHLPKLTSGAAGKLRIRESGKATLSWGGMSFTVSMGMQASFLQESVCARMEEGEPDKEGKATVKGEAMNFGAVRGKFVVVPDWDEILR